jgi:hypothetical protein
MITCVNRPKELTTPANFRHFLVERSLSTRHLAKLFGVRNEQLNKHLSDGHNNPQATHSTLHKPLPLMNRHKSTRNKASTTHSFLQTSTAAWMSIGTAAKGVLGSFQGQDNNNPILRTSSLL